MSVPVRSYQRNKLLGDKTSPKFYFLRQEPGSSKVSTIESIAQDIEASGALSAEDVTHTMKSFVRQLKKVLIEGNKVKVEGLGTFYITFSTTGTAVEKDCTVKNINRVNIRFAVDNSLRLANDTTATTRGGANNVSFYIKGETAPSSGGGSDDGGGGEEDPDA